jgi:hypothetical protein
VLVAQAQSAPRKSADGRGAVHVDVPRPNGKPTKKLRVLTEVLVETAGLNHVRVHIDRMFKEKSDGSWLEILSLDHMKSCVIYWRGGKAEFQADIVIEPSEYAEPEKEKWIRTFFLEHKIPLVRKTVFKYGYMGSPRAHRTLAYALGNNREQVAKRIAEYLKTVVGIHPGDGLSFQFMSDNARPKKL